MNETFPTEREWTEFFELKQWKAFMNMVQDQYNLTIINLRDEFDTNMMQRFQGMAHALGAMLEFEESTFAALKEQKEEREEDV